MNYILFSVHIYIAQLLESWAALSAKPREAIDKILRYTDLRSFLANES